MSFAPREFEGHGMFNWIDNHGTLLTVLGGVSVVMLLGSLVAIPVMVVRLPANYFVDRRRRRLSWRQRHRRLSLTSLVIQNSIGGVLILAGIAMLVLPGQGILAILVGLMVADFPGKFQLERWLAFRKPVMRVMNAIRDKAGKPPLETPNQQSPEDSSK